jgi:DNA-binding transcriptional regulator YhcF (GntR family)
VDLGIEFTAGVPLRRQLEQALRVAIRSGWLAPGSLFPSSRASDLPAATMLLADAIDGSVRNLA